MLPFIPNLIHEQYCHVVFVCNFKFNTVKHERLKAINKIIILSRFISSKQVDGNTMEIHEKMPWALSKPFQDLLGWKIGRYRSFS